MGCSSSGAVRAAQIPEQVLLKPPDAASSSEPVKPQQKSGAVPDDLVTCSDSTASDSAALLAAGRKEAVANPAECTPDVLREASAADARAGPPAVVSSSIVAPPYDLQLVEPPLVAPSPISSGVTAPTPPPLEPEDVLPPPVSARPFSGAARDKLASPVGHSSLVCSSLSGPTKKPAWEDDVQEELRDVLGCLDDGGKSGTAFTALTALPGSTAHSSSAASTALPGFDELQFAPRPSNHTSASSTPRLGRRTGSSIDHSPHPFDEREHREFPPRSPSALVPEHLGGLGTMAEEDILDLFDEMEERDDHDTQLEVQGLMSNIRMELFAGALAGTDSQQTGASSRKMLSLTTQDERLMQEILEDLD